MKRLVICIFNHSDRVKSPVVTRSCLRNHAKCLQNRYRPKGALTWYPYLAACIIGQSDKSQICSLLVNSQTLSANLCTKSVSDIALGRFWNTSLRVHCFLNVKRLQIANMLKSRRNKLNNLLSQVWNA